MFQSGHWAAALINSIEREGGEIEDGIEFLKVLASWVKKLPAESGGRYAAGNSAAGSSAAQKLEKLIRDGITKNNEALSPGQESALRTFLLMVQKNAIRSIEQVIEKTKKLLDKKNGVIAVSVEYALPIGDNGSRIKEEIKKRSAAVRVDLTEHYNPDLIGGYRLRIDDEIIDASVRSQLRRLSDHLTMRSY